MKIGLELVRVVVAAVVDSGDEPRRSLRRIRSGLLDLQDFSAEQSNSCEFSCRGQIAARQGSECGGK